MSQEPYVLMVEDNADDVELTLRSFKKNAFPLKIVVSTDGAKALEFLGINKAPSLSRNIPPVLILLDLNLPKVPGLEILRRVRADSYLKSVPVIIVTSSNREQERAETQRSAANLYLRKPIDFNDFDEVVLQVQDFLVKHKLL